MATATTSFFTNTETHRQTICDYLADLPLLDRQVLFQRFAQRTEVAGIAENLRITTAHVEHILRRTEEFKKSLVTRRKPAASATTAWNVKQIPHRVFPELLLRTAQTTRAFRPMPRMDFVDSPA